MPPRREARLGYHTPYLQPWSSRFLFSCPHHLSALGWPALQHGVHPRWSPCQAWGVVAIQEDHVRDQDRWVPLILIGLSLRFFFSHCLVRSEEAWEGV